MSALTPETTPTPASADAGKAARKPSFWATSTIVPTAALAAAALVAFLSTWFLMSPAVEWIDRDVISALIVGNVVIAAGFAMLIGARLWHVLSDRRNQLAGSRTHMQLVWAFSIVAAAPAVIAFLFAFSILRSSLNDVFGERIENYVNTARELANAYFNAEANEDYVDLRQIELDQLQDQLLGLTPSSAPIVYRQRLFEQAIARDLAAIFILDEDHRVIARAEVMDGSFRLPPKAVFDEIDAAAAAGKPKSEWGKYDLNDERRIDYFRGLLKSDVLDGGYILFFRPVPNSVSERLFSVRAMRDDWNVAKTGRDRLERVFLAGYVVMAIIILFGAIWAGLQAATRIVKPIGRLVGMAEEVSGGDLGARVRVMREDGELSVLARAMNHMTAQLQAQRDDLIETNRQSDRRRRFTEAVLSSVSAGVVGVTAEGRLAIANRSAEELLRIDAARDVGAPLCDVAPEFCPLIDQAAEALAAGVGVETAGQLDIQRDGQPRTLNVRIATDVSGGERSFVATFDDITALGDAQRSAAWGDVARRIAHEIKNPLTPIQLSAERLRRKYLSEIGESPEVFDRCTETIIRHVSDIGRMVDEFSSFARMPAPQINEENLVELAKSAIFTQRVAFPDVDFRLRTDEDAAPVRCDGRLIVQALGNLMKNACEAIEARRVGAPEPSPAVEVRIGREDGRVRLDVIDNGVGLPAAERHRLTEPYMTTRAKGTGLGLAIVRKVVEEHDGSLHFSDADALGPTGAQVTMLLPDPTAQRLERLPADAGAASAAAE
ncbi:MAG: ATP-binding protein [Parvularculaceae bacterium]